MYFTKMGAYSTNSLQEKKISFTTGYPIRKEVIPGHLKVGWEIMQTLPLFVKFISFKSLFKSKNIGFLYFLTDHLMMFYNFLVSFFNNKTKYDFKTYSNSEIQGINNLDTFFEEWNFQQEISLKKSKEFLKWRLGAPEKEYSISVFSEKNKIIGYTVFCNTVKEKIPSIAILDVSILNGYSGISNFIFKHIETIAKRRKKESIIIMCSTYFFKIHKMKKSGFIKTPFKFFLIIKNLSSEFNNEYLKNEENWHLSWIDSDNL